MLFRGSVCAQTSVSTRHKNFFITFSFSRRALFSKPRFDSSCVFVQNQSECAHATRQSTCARVHHDPSRRRRQESRNTKHEHVCNTRFVYTPHPQNHDKNILIVSVATHHRVSFTNTVHPQKRMKCVKDEEPFVIKVPKGEPVKCHHDREGTITVYVVTEDDTKTTTTASQVAPSPTSDVARKKLLADIFGSDDEDDTKHQTITQGESMTHDTPTPHGAVTYVTRDSTEVQLRQEEEKKKQEEQQERQELDGTCTVFVDPNTTLMDKTNISKLMSPFIATRVWNFPTRAYDMVHDWKPEEEKKPDQDREEANAEGRHDPGVVSRASSSSTYLVSSPPGMMKSPSLPPSSPHPSSSTALPPQPREDLWCWHDCHPFKGRPFRLPWAYNSRNETYSVVGYFCSPACARAFNNSWDMCVSGKTKRDNLVTDMAIRHYGYSFRSKSCPDQISVFPIAPDRLLLKQFGGPLTIEEFRKYTLPDCRLHVSLEFPYIIVPQIALEHVVSDETGASQRRSIYNASKVHTQQAEPLKVQTRSDELSDCCKQNKCRKRTFAEAATKKKKEESDKKQMTFQQQEPEEVSVLDQVKRAVWNEKRKRMFEPSRNSSKRIQQRQRTDAGENDDHKRRRHHEKKTTTPPSRQGTHTSNTVVADVDPIVDKTADQPPPKKKRRGSSSSASQKARPTSQQPPPSQQQHTQQRGYKMLKDILSAVHT